MQLRIFEILQTCEHANPSLLWTILVMLYNKALALAFGACVWPPLCCPGRLTDRGLHGASISGTIGYLCFQPHHAPLHTATISGLIGSLVFVTATTFGQTVWLSFWSMTLPQWMKFEPWLPLPVHLALIANYVSPVEQQQKQPQKVTRHMVEKKTPKETDSTSSFTGSSSSSHQGSSHSATNSSPSDASTAVSAYRAAQQPNTTNGAPPLPIPVTPVGGQLTPIASGRKRGEPDYEKMPDLWDSHAQA